MDEKQHDLQHHCTVKERESMQISGVTEVESFDEESIRLITTCGLLTVNGKNLQLVALQPETGDVRLNGQVDSLVYSAHEQRSFLRRLFR